MGKHIRRRHSCRSAGFTLIELMIAVLILGILVAIAMPQYQQYVTNSYQSTCAAKLVEMSNQMERIFTENQTYQPGGSAPSANDLVNTATCPADTQPAPYNLSVNVPDDTSYTLSATPQGRQANNSDCGTLTLDQAGVRTAGGSASGEECW